jgi:hypothetical protein
MTRCGISLFIAALLLQMPAARTAPLDKGGCATLKVEQGELEKAGTRGNMGKGPQWAKTNLQPEKLDQIRRLLEVDEQLLFRCHGKPLVNLPKDPTDADPAAREPEAKGPAPRTPKAGKKEAAKKAAAQPADQPAKDTAKDEAEAGKASPEPKGSSPAKADNKPESKPEKKTAQQPTAAKKSKSKPKVDDAYRVPATDPGSNPFGQQPASKP